MGGRGIPGNSPDPQLPSFGGPGNSRGIPRGPNSDFSRGRGIRGNWIWGSRYLIITLICCVSGAGELKFRGRGIPGNFPYPRCYCSRGPGNSRGIRLLPQNGRVGEPGNSGEFPSIPISIDLGVRVNPGEFPWGPQTDDLGGRGIPGNSNGAPKYPRMGDLFWGFCWGPRASCFRGLGFGKINLFEVKVPQTDSWTILTYMVDDREAFL